MNAEILMQSLEQSGRSDILNMDITHDTLCVCVQTDKIAEFLTFLRDSPDYRFIQLIDLCGVDYPNRVNRFDVVYHLLSLHKNMRIRIKVQASEASFVPSVTGVYPVAEWNEREAFDMYGIQFSNHPDLRRILTDYGFSGYPLRKDFPTTGYVELRYDDEAKRVVYENVKLTQDYRAFDFLSPWEGAKYAVSSVELNKKENQ